MVERRERLVRSSSQLTHRERQKSLSLLKLSILQEVLWVEDIWSGPLLGVPVQCS